MSRLNYVKKSNVCYYVDADLIYPVKIEQNNCITRGNYIYSKTCLKRPSKIDKTKVFQKNRSLMKVKSIVDSAILLTCIKR